MSKSLAKAKANRENVNQFCAVNLGAGNILNSSSPSNSNSIKSNSVIVLTQTGFKTPDKAMYESGFELVEVKYTLKTSKGGSILKHKVKPTILLSKQMVYDEETKRRIAALLTLLALDDEDEFRKRNDSDVIEPFHVIVGLLNEDMSKDETKELKSYLKSIKFDKTDTYDQEPMTEYMTKALATRQLYQALVRLLQNESCLMSIKYPTGGAGARGARTASLGEFNVFKIKTVKGELALGAITHGSLVKSGKTNPKTGKPYPNPIPGNYTWVVFKHSAGIAIVGISEDKYTEQEATDLLSDKYGFKATTAYTFTTKATNIKSRHSSKSSLVLPKSGDSVTVGALKVIFIDRLSS